MHDAETIQKITELATTAKPPERIDAYTSFVRDNAGKPIMIPTPPKPKTSIVFRVEDLVANVIHNTDGGAEIYYSRHGLRGFYAIDRRESVTMRLTKSKPFALLEKWDQKSETLKQDEFVLLLKTIFRGCCDDMLEKIIRTIRWTMGNNGESTVKYGGVSMNKSIMAEMTGADDLNKIEYVVFDVPVFLELPDVRFRIECHLRPIPDQQLFSVIPTGGGIETAYRFAEEVIGTAILSALGDSETTWVYHGVAQADNADAPKLTA